MWISSWQRITSRSSARSEGKREGSRTTGSRQPNVTGLAISSETSQRALVGVAIRKTGSEIELRDRPSAIAGETYESEDEQGDSDYDSRCEYA